MRARRWGIVKEVVVDDGFVNLLDLQECKKEGVVVYAPVEAEGPVWGRQRLRGRSAGSQPSRPTTAVHGGAYTARKEPTKASRSRPEGKVELPVIIYGCAAEQCQACRQQPQCTRTPTRGREVKRFEGEEVLEELRQRMRRPASQELYKERKKSVERSNAEIKEQRGLRLFHSYGLSRAKAQAALVGLTMNGLRLEKSLLQRDAKAVGDPPKQVA